MKALCFFLFFVPMTAVFSQNRDFEFPDKEAEFPGGVGEMKRFVSNELEYPQEAILNGDEGRVYVTFVVEPDGKLTNIEIYKEGVTPELNAEAIRIISNMPNWVPAELKGENIPARCRMPIDFELNPKYARRVRREHRKRK